MSDHPSGVESIEIAEHMSFNLGGAFQRGWSYHKGNALDNLKNMLRHVEREIARLATHDYSDWLHSDPGFRRDFQALMAERGHAFNRPSPWCEPVRHALAAICDYYCQASPTERDRLLAKVKRCLQTAIEDECCFDGRAMQP